MDKKQPKRKKNFLFAISGAIAFLWLGIQLFMDAKTNSKPMLSKTVGIISIAFWTALIVGAFYAKFIKKKKT